MAKFFIAIIEWLSSMTMAFFSGKQSAELQHARETEESLADTAERLANRPVDRDDLVARLRAKAADQRGKPNNLS